MTNLKTVIMRDMQFKYVLQHKETRSFIGLLLSLDRIEEGGATDILNKLTEYSLIAKCEYAGLKDRNGKEIYEGDIVKAWDNAAMDEFWGLDKVHTGVITFETNCFTLKVGNVSLDHWVNAENFEVVGDIYETPHLLNADPNPEPSVASEDASSNDAEFAEWVKNNWYFERLLWCWVRIDSPKEHAQEYKDLYQIFQQQKQKP